MQKPFYLAEDIPNEKDDPEFWQTLQSPGFKHSINFLIINEIRKYDPEALSTASIRSQLAKLKAYQELLDLPKALLEKDKEPELTDELPTT